MATQLFFRDVTTSDAEVHLGTNNTKLDGTATGWGTNGLAPSRGTVLAVATANTVAGTTLGVEVIPLNAGSMPGQWISPPLAADVTIAGTITLNLWASENNMSANVAINAVIDVIRANVLGTANSNTIVQIAKTARVVEVAVSTRDVHNFTVTPTSTVVNRGDRIRVRVFGDDVGTMASTFTFNFGYNGATAAADGDSYVTFTENITFENAPGTGVLEQPNQSVAVIFGWTSSPDTRVGQEFSAAGSLAEVRLWLMKTGAPTDNVIIEVQTDSSGSPSGTVVGTVATVTGASLTTTLTQYTYPCSISLTASTTYHLVVRRDLDALDASNYFRTSQGTGLLAGKGFRRWRPSAWLSEDGSNSLTVRLGFSGLATSTVYLTNTQSGLTGAPALISSFTGSDENPLSEGGNWANLNTSLAPLQRLSNEVRSSILGIGQSYWTPTNFGPDLEAYITLVSPASASMGISARIQGEGGANTWDGYVVRTNGLTTMTMGAWTNGVSGGGTSFTSLPFTWAAGDKLGARFEGSTIQCWRQASGSSEWNLVASIVDTTYSSAGKVGIYVGNNNGAVDDFYAATDSNLFTQKAWTSRGSGVVSYLSDTDTGWTAPLLTNEWFTPPLTAFTLTGMAQANIRALESNALANASLRCEIARVEGDGTSPTVWSSWCCAPTGTDNGELTTSEVARTINLSGDDLAISNGQRLRIRLYNEDMSSAAMANTYNVQRFYNGTSGGASGDSYITFPQTLTEYSPPVPHIYIPVGYAQGRDY